MFSANVAFSINASSHAERAHFQTFCVERGTLSSHQNRKRNLDNCSILCIWNPTPVRGWNHDTPCLSWHFQSLPRLQVSFCNAGEFNEARSLMVRGLPAPDSPLGQVVLLKIRCPPGICFHRFSLLSSHDTGHYCVPLFGLVLVSVDLIGAPTPSEKPSSRRGSRQTECQAWKLRGWGQNATIGTSFSSSKTWD